MIIKLTKVTVLHKSRSQKDLWCVCKYVVNKKRLYVAVCIYSPTQGIIFGDLTDEFNYIIQTLPFVSSHINKVEVQ